MAYKKINGVNLYYEQAGHGDTTLVLVHGNLASARWWDLMWEPLAELYTVVRMDLRGARHSDKPGEGYNVPQYSADVRALIRELGLRDVFLFGHSMGGSIAMHAAISEPELFKGMILLSTGPAEGIFTPEEVRAVIEVIKQDRGLMNQALGAMVPTANTTEFFELLVDDAMVAKDTWIPNYISLGEEDMRERLATLTLPTQIVHGMIDSLITLEMTERTQQAIAGSGVLFYEEVGHSANVESPERLLADVQKFVEHVQSL